jgi:hypothetical protein
MISLLGEAASRGQYIQIVCYWVLDAIRGSVASSSLYSAARRRLGRSLRFRGGGKINCFGRDG